MSDAFIIEIIEESQLGDARRQVVRSAHILGLSEKHQDRLALITTELATNLLKHTAKGGKLIVQSLSDGERIGIDIFSLDSGRGMNIYDCIEDGVSSTGTFGNGLGTVKRLSDQFDIHSETMHGSAVHSRIWNREISEGDSLSGGLTVPIIGERLSGDKWAIRRVGQQRYCILVDGLGHGFEAAEAAKLALQRFDENLDLAPSQIIKAMHSSLRGTRGAVAAVARIDCARGTLDFCGLGNIAAILVNDTYRKHLTSLNGTLGYEARKVTEFKHPWNQASLLVMHSDGLSSRAFESIQAVKNKTAPLIAAWLYQMNSKGTDDSTALVCKD